MWNVARILCPIDFSDASQHALAQAIVIARFFRARITVLHVHSQPYLPVPAYGMLTDVGTLALSPEDTQRLREDVERFAAPAREAGLAVSIVVEPGMPVSHILATAKTLPADLIVIGTHGVSGFERLVLGSVTEKVLRKATCPVLTVPPRTEQSAAVPFKHIVCAVDFSEASLKALTTALALAQEADAALTLVHVLEWPAPQTSGTVPAAPELGTGGVFDLERYRTQLEAEAADRLKTLIPAGAKEWCTPETRILHGKPWAEILAAATARQADLIVIGVRGRNPVDVMLFGSTANQLVRRATCPVLTTA